MQRGWFAWLLKPLAAIFGLLTWLRRLLYRVGIFTTAYAGVPVVIVGNVVAGGSGKTPVVVALANHLMHRGLRVGVLSRGYGRSSTGCVEVHAQLPVSASGDEPALIKRATGLPVFVASDRAEAAHALLAAYPDTQLLLCDDGLQHYGLHRDIEIAVFDDRGVGNGWLLPAGPLRERWPQRLHDGIDMVVHTGAKPAFEGYTAGRKLADYGIAADGRVVALRSLAGRRLTAMAGIAQPEAFFAMLRAAGLTLSDTISLPDHYDFRGFSLSAGNDSTVLCTSKDAAKLFAQPSMAGVELLEIPLEISLEPAFLMALDKLLAIVLSPLPSGHGH
jgi:tetraacyldisaccharide 4'-kinase